MLLGRLRKFSSVLRLCVYCHERVLEFVKCILCLSDHVVFAAYYHDMA